MVERCAVNARVAGSSPAFPAMEASHNWWWSGLENRRSKDLGVRVPPLPLNQCVAQLVERMLREHEVGGSFPLTLIKLPM